MQCTNLNIHLKNSTPVKLVPKQISKDMKTHLCHFFTFQENSDWRHLDITQRNKQAKTSNFWRSVYKYEEIFIKQDLFHISYLPPPRSGRIWHKVNL